MVRHNRWIKSVTLLGSKISYALCFKRNDVFIEFSPIDIRSKIFKVFASFVRLLPLCEKKNQLASREPSCVNEVGENEKAASRYNVY